MSDSVESKHPIRQLTKEQRDDIFLGFEPFPPDYDINQETEYSPQDIVGPLVQLILINKVFRRLRKVVLEGDEIVVGAEERQVSVAAGGGQSAVVYEKAKLEQVGLNLYRLRIDSELFKAVFSTSYSDPRQLTTVLKHGASLRNFSMNDVFRARGGNPEDKTLRLVSKLGGNAFSSTTEEIGKRLGEIDDEKEAATPMLVDDSGGDMYTVVYENMELKSIYD